MIAGLDSATEPSAAQVRMAAAAGIRIWSGYLASTPYDGNPAFGLWHPWSQGAFENAKLCGSTPIAYASGWDDPAACKAKAAAWGVLLCLDVESGIRGDGPWVQGWLDASGAGLYGNAPVFRTRRAPFYVVAAYLGYDPQSTWVPAYTRPAGPCGWQWQGTHTEFGVGVDSNWFDDSFAGLHGSGAGILIGDHMDLSNPIDKEVYDGLRDLQFGIFYAEDAAPLADGSKPAVFAKQFGDRVRAILAAAPKPTAAVDQATLTAAVTAALAPFKLELDAISADVATIKRRVEKDLAP